jgi:hypothetical protein
MESDASVNPKTQKASRLPRAIRRHEGQYRPLLISLVVLFLLYPVMVETGWLRGFRLVFLGVLFFGAYSVKRRRKLLIAAVVLGIPAAAGQILTFSLPARQYAFIAGLLTLGFLIFTCLVILRSVFEGGKVTTDKLYAAVCVYLLIGLIWAIFYALAALVAPASFNSLIYYSFVTLTTLGYGDITPATSMTQTLAWMEAATGQLFVAILIARLVGLHISDSANPDE